MLKQQRTPAQIEASRRNGAKSKGPVTPEGRAISSSNALKHGLRSERRITLENEDADAFQELLDGYLKAYVPANEPEHQLVLEIARCAWRLERLAAMEAAMFDLEMLSNANDSYKPRPAGFTPDERAARAFGSICIRTSKLDVLLRYQTATRRGLLSATTALSRMQAERNRRPAAEPKQPELPNEPENTPKENSIPREHRDLTSPAPARVPLGFPKPQPVLPVVDEPPVMRLVSQFTLDQRFHRHPRQNHFRGNSKPEFLVCA